MLLHREQRYIGAKIKSINIPHVTVIDVVALLSLSRYEMEVMVWNVVAEHSGFVGRALDWG